MAFPGKSTVESIESSSDSAPTSKKPAPSGPPKAKPSPRSAADSSLFSSVGKTATQSGQSGLGPEGSSPQLMTMQGFAMVQRGVQMMNLANPENPGLVAVLTDLMGRLQVILPQLTGQNPAAGGMGLFPNQMGMGQPGGMPGGGMGGPPPMGAPPMAGPPMMPPTGLPPQ